MTLAQILHFPFPFAGQINAGPTAWVSPAEEELQDTLTFEEWLALDKEATLMFTASNDAMAGRGILKGDTVLFERGADVVSGDVVVARADGVLLLRTYDKAGDSISLIPANRSYQVIQPQEELVILGRVKAVIRKY
jgi:repressor LexA